MEKSNKWSMYSRADWIRSLTGFVILSTSFESFNVCGSLCAALVMSKDQRFSIVGEALHSGS